MPIRAFVVVLPMLTFLLAGCGAPPTAEADAARQSMTRASSAGADTYAAASLKEAQAAQARASMATSSGYTWRKGNVWPLGRSLLMGAFPTRQRCPMW